MQPIHYGLTLAIMAILFGAGLAWHQGQPLVFIVTLLMVYLLGNETVAKFSVQQGHGPGDDDPDDYQGTAAGFTQDK